MADEPTQPAEPITPPESHPPDAKPLVDSPAEQASPDGDTAPDQQAPDPNAEHVAYLKSLPPEKLLELRADLAQRQQDEINKGIQRTLSKQREKDARDVAARDAAAAREAERAQRAADKAAKRDLARRGRAEEWDVVQQAATQKIDEWEQEAYAPEPPDPDELNAWVAQTKAQARGETEQSITHKIKADILNDPRTKGIDPSRINDLIEGDLFTDFAFNTVLAAGGLDADGVADLKKVHTAEMEAAVRSARAEALGELDTHDLPRGVGVNGNGAGGMSWEALQGMAPSERLAWRDKHPAQYDSLTQRVMARA